MDKPSKQLTQARVYSGLNDNDDDIGACLMESAQDLSLKCFHLRKMKELFPTEYGHLDSKYDTSLLVPIRSHELNVIAVLCLSETVLNTVKLDQIIQFCRQMSGPIELSNRIETDQILAIRRFTSRTQHVKLQSTFRAWKRQHTELQEGRINREKQVAWMQNVKRRHKQTSEYHVICAWTTFVMRSRGEKIRHYQQELEDVRKFLPKEDEDDL